MDVHQRTMLQPSDFTGLVSIGRGKGKSPLEPCHLRNTRLGQNSRLLSHGGCFGMLCSCAPACRMVSGVFVATRVEGVLRWQKYMATRSAFRDAQCLVATGVWADHVAPHLALRSLRAILSVVSSS